MNKIKSSPHVYPYTPFDDLSNKELKSVFKKHKKIDWKKVKEIISDQVLDINDLDIDKSQSKKEQLYQLFTNNKVRFGDLELISIDKDLWLKRFEYFIKKDEKIVLTILGFPFKVPLLLKTNRDLPDMGDVLALNRLNNMVELVKEIYPQGARIVIFTEGSFAGFSEHSPKVVAEYEDFLEEMVKQLGFTKNLKLFKLGKMEREPSFENLYLENIKHFRKLYEQKDEEYMKRFEGTISSIYRVIPPKVNNINLLCDIYNDNLAQKRLTNKIKKIRKSLKERSQETTMKYHAYLKTRDDLDFIQKTFPHSLPLSVSPKRGRIGLLPINENITKIPHHALTIYDAKKNKFDLVYYIDLLRDGSEYTPVYLAEDPEDKPFYYIKD